MHRFIQIKSLCIIDTDFFQLIQGKHILHMFGYGFYIHHFADLIDRSDHRFVSGVVWDVFDDVAIYLQIIDR